MSDPDEAKKRLEREVKFFIADNRPHLNDEAIKVLWGMSAADQRRVIAGGPLDICKDLGLLFRTRVNSNREREKELAERKGVDASKFVRDASDDEVQQWLSSNKEYIDHAATEQFKALDPQDKFRVISEGPLRESVDAAHVIKTRAERSREMANEVAAIFAMRTERNSEPSKPKAAVEKSVSPAVAAMIQEQFASYRGPEVPAHLRRCAGFGNVKTAETEQPAMVGNVKGVGGVVEILKSKYGCTKGQRYRVIGECGGAVGMWRLEGEKKGIEKTVPKNHVKEGGWKWVVESDAQPQKTPASETQEEQGAPEGTSTGDAEDKPENTQDKSKNGSRSQSHSRKSRNVSHKNGKAKSSSRSRGRRDEKAKNKKKRGSQSRSRKRGRSRSRGRGAKQSRSRSRSKSSEGRKGKSKSRRKRSKSKRSCSHSKSRRKKSASRGSCSHSKSGRMRSASRGSCSHSKGSSPSRRRRRKRR